ncbi:GST-like protein [Sphingomonas trueperi]|uniref:glutathione S-transferase family protein n=1 Tax=Sphingomonas trueperi TaxID=53317 RepID=UPI003391993F
MPQTAPQPPALELIGARTGNCLRVAIAMEEAGLAYAVRRLNLRDGEQRSPSHLRLNPAGKVPTLIDRRGPETLTISQSNAILLHLARTTSGLLLPEDPARHALALERFFYFVTDVIGPSHAAFRARQLGDDDAADHLDGVAVMALAAANAFPAPGGYMAGDNVTLADIAAFTIAGSYRTVLDLGKFANFVAWYQRMGTRTAVLRGMGAWD